MCEEVVKCVQDDPRIKAWVIDIVHKDLQSSVLSKILAVLAIIIAKYSDYITEFIKGAL